jgi:hypothetical protein
MGPDHVQALETVLVCCGAAYLMVQSGTAKQLLQWKRRPACPSCGRTDRDCSCRPRVR